MDGLTQYQAEDQRPPYLETLPLEIQIMILRRLSDINALSALIHASPIYHSTYLGSRETIFTILTLRTLQSRGVKILPACSAAQVCLHNLEPPSIETKFAIQALYKQVEAPEPPQILRPKVSFIPKRVQRRIGMRFKPEPHYSAHRQVTAGERIKLSLEHCFALLKVAHMIPYWRVVDKSSRFHRKNNFQCWRRDFEAGHAAGWPSFNYQTLSFEHGALENDVPGVDRDSLVEVLKYNWGDYALEPVR